MKMCADSLTKIKTSSVLNMSNGKIQSFTDAKHAKVAFNRFAAFYDEANFTDIILSGCDHRK